MSQLSMQAYLDQCQPLFGVSSFASPMFPPTAEISTADDKNRHLTRCMAGAFTCSEANAAAKLLGFPLPKKVSKQQLSPGPMDSVCLLCLNHFSQTFISWKP